jgi:cbb3-type cytochrome oxidase cytochrome c subunit
MGRGRGPDLGTVGKDPTHTVDWLMEHIRDAKTHKPESRMPPYKDKIQTEDLRALAEYLASLK